ncbi:hypothetical protein PMKS-000423 [Pichia membranifaciens]|uniref:Zn(2)-C6 fungal-type domain-containing protein n=1 Tax=Pichia membranifaciens TaxID=4926 RepID=A0A1Q2YBP7_9ASCO|nr:hypothetical protein PMKS-000423 [Pichia membranifaciens]
MSNVYYPHINPKSKSAPNQNQGYAAPLNLMAHKLAKNYNHPFPKQNGLLQPPAQLHHPTTHLPPHFHAHRHNPQPPHVQPLPSNTNYTQIATVNHEMSFSFYPFHQPKDDRFANPNPALLKRKRAFSKRSKTGCLTCRERRIKCDECRPMCKNCEKSKKNCNFPSLEQLKKEKHHIKRTKLSRKKKKSTSILAILDRENETSFKESPHSDIASVNTNSNANANANINSSVNRNISSITLSINQPSYQAFKPQNNLVDNRFILSPVSPCVSIPILPPITNTHPTVQYQIYQSANTPSIKNSANHHVFDKSISEDRNIYQYENQLLYPTNLSNTLASPTINNSSLMDKKPRLTNYDHRREQGNSSFSTNTSTRSSPGFSTSGSSISTNDQRQFLYPQVKYTTATATQNPPNSLSSNNNGSAIANSISEVIANTSSNGFKNSNVQMYDQGNLPFTVSYAL